MNNDDLKQDEQDPAVSQAQTAEEARLKKLALRQTLRKETREVLRVARDQIREHLTDELLVTKLRPWTSKGFYKVVLAEAEFDRAFLPEGSSVNLPPSNYRPLIVEVLQERGLSIQGQDSHLYVIGWA